MHEMSLALNIVDIITSKAQEENASKITEIDLEVGDLAGIELHALEFCMEEACKNTLADGANIIYNQVGAKARCIDCKHEFEPDFLFTRCPSCGGFKVDVIQGKEFKIRSINID